MRWIERERGGVREGVGEGEGERGREGGGEGRGGRGGGRGGKGRQRWGERDTGRGWGDRERLEQILRPAEESFHVFAALAGSCFKGCEGQTVTFFSWL